LDRNEIDAYAKVDLGELGCHYIKPPLGLMPKAIHDENRMDDIKEAVNRMFVTNDKVCLAWIEEYNELCDIYHRGGRDEKTTEKEIFQKRQNYFEKQRIF
jgi:hypothetical protein